MFLSRPTSRPALTFWTISAGLIVLWCLILALFNLFPGLDIAAQRLFFVATPCPDGAPTGRICGMFPYGNDPVFRGLRFLLYYLPFVAAAVIIWVLVAALSRHGSDRDEKTIRRTGIVLGTLALGPILLVNLFLKESSGRPRPLATDLFGGPMPFMPAGDFGGACTANCSFISGEAAGACWLLCAFFLLPKRFREPFLPLAVAISVTKPAMRMAFGGHYLSDILLGWLSTLIVFTLLCALFNWHRPATQDRRQTAS